MGIDHDKLTTLTGDYIVKKIRENDASWKQIFSSTLGRVGDWSWPRPDYVCKDHENGVTYAFEFKPPNQTKREYLTGLGQSLSYLQKHHYSGLIVPELSDDGFPIAQFIQLTLESDEFKHLPISLISYIPEKLEFDIDNAIKILKKITSERSTTLIDSTSSVNSTYWAFWRDMSHFELFELLKLSDQYSSNQGDIYSEYIYPKFYQDFLIGGKALDWEGNHRVKTDSDASKRSEKQNYKIPLFHLNLWNQVEGRLTYKGYKLLTFGKMFGVTSTEFKDYLSYLLLTEGRHLELIHEVEQYQRLNKGTIPETSEKFKLSLDNYLEAKGSIGDRKPTAITTGAKVSYIRDEFKVWNKLGLIYCHSRHYFTKGEGLRFNWGKITDLLMKKYSIED